MDKSRETNKTETEESNDNEAHQEILNALVEKIRSLMKPRTILSCNMRFLSFCTKMRLIRS